MALNGETKEYVDTLESADEIVKQIKENYNTEELEIDIQINEKYTINTDEITTDSIDVASNAVQTAVEKIRF